MSLAKLGRQIQGPLRDVLEVVIFAFILFILLQFVVMTVRVSGYSMENTFHNNDLLVAERISLDFSGPSRGQVVIINPPGIPGEQFIKRVIGLPGDKIEITGNYPVAGHPGQTQTAILIEPGGKGPWDLVEEPFLPQPWVVNTSCCLLSGQESATPTVETIPPNDYFVMGDNRNYSEDSRFFGWVPKSHLVSVVLFRFWPLTAFGGYGPGPTLVPAPYPPQGIT